MIEITTTSVAKILPNTALAVNPTNRCGDVETRELKRFYLTGFGANNRSLAPVQMLIPHLLIPWLYRC